MSNAQRERPYMRVEMKCLYFGKLLLEIMKMKCFIFVLKASCHWRCTEISTYSATLTRWHWQTTEKQPQLWCSQCIHFCHSRFSHAGAGNIGSGKYILIWHWAKFSCPFWHFKRCVFVPKVSDNISTFFPFFVYFFAVNVMTLTMTCNNIIIFTFSHNVIYLFIRSHRIWWELIALISLLKYE